MKAYLFLIICVVFSSKLVAQNEIYFSFLNSYNIINPAYTDFTPDAWFSLHSKHLNLKMEGAPHSSGIYYTSGSNSLQKIGWNFNTFRTKYGYRITGHTMAAINYKTKLNKTNFAFALQLGFSNNYFDYSTAGSTSNLSDPEFVNTSKRFRPNVGFGFFIKNPNYYIGYSAPIIFNYDNTHRTKASEFNSELQNTYHYFFGGADIKTGEKTYIRPVFSALMR